MGRNWSAHGHKPKVMDEMFSACVETYKRVVENALHLDELLVIVVIVDWFYQGFSKGSGKGLGSC